MFFGFVAVMKAFEGAMLMAQRPARRAKSHFVLAAQMIGLAVLMDGLDGRIARMTNTTSDFGREMDSMADAITFGVAPAVLAFAWGFHGHRHERQCLRPRPSAAARVFRLLSVSLCRVRPAGPLQHHYQSRAEKSRSSGPQIFRRLADSGSGWTGCGVRLCRRRVIRCIGGPSRFAGLR